MLNNLSPTYTVIRIPCYERTSATKTNFFQYCTFWMVKNKKKRLNGLNRGKKESVSNNTDTTLTLQLPKLSP